jgi:hypothetical protein
MKRLKTIIKENTTLKDKELTIWEEHPNYMKKFDEIKSFCQSNSFTEDDSFEKEYFEKLQYELSDREDEIRGLLKAIDFTYDYLEKLIKEEKSKDNTEQK